MVHAPGRALHPTTTLDLHAVWQPLALLPTLPSSSGGRRQQGCSSKGGGTCVLYCQLYMYSWLYSCRNRIQPLGAYSLGELRVAPALAVAWPCPWVLINLSQAGRTGWVIILECSRVPGQKRPTSIHLQRS